ncbi:MAG: hypothetical protein ACKOC8_07470 [Pirellulales bacterium]
MSSRTRIVRGGACLAAVIVAVCAGLRGVSGEPHGHGPVMLANRCILCSSYGANQMPRICNSCNNKFSNRCILCNSYGANQAPRICNSCNNKFSNRCILCNSYGANQAPRICTSCNNKF